MSSYIGVPYFQDAELTVVKNRLTTAENTIVANKSTYDTKVAQIDSTTGNHETRLVTAEGKISQIETDITVQVNEAISTRIAQTTFDSLKQELTENTQGDLARALASAVAETVQNSVIDSKVAQVAYDADKTEQANTNTNHLIKLNAIEEFINVFLAANVLKYNDNTVMYTYTGAKQNIVLTAPAPAPTPTDQLTITNATIDGNYLVTFTVTSNVDFVPGSVYVTAASSVYSAQVLDADMNPRYSFPTGEPVICKAQFGQNPESLSFTLNKSGTVISNMFTPTAPAPSPSPAPAPSGSPSDYRLNFNEINSQYQWAIYDFNLESIGIQFISGSKTSTPYTITAPNGSNAIDIAMADRTLFATGDVIQIILNGDTTRTPLTNLMGQVVSQTWPF